MDIYSFTDIAIQKKIGEKFDSCEICNHFQRILCLCKTINPRSDVSDRI